MTQIPKKADALFSELGLDTVRRSHVYQTSPENVAQLKQGYKELKAECGTERELIDM